jgi:hypothetical protein
VQRCNELPETSFLLNKNILKKFDIMYDIQEGKCKINIDGQQYNILKSGSIICDFMLETYENNFSIIWIAFGFPDNIPQSTLSKFFSKIWIAFGFRVNTIHSNLSSNIHFSNFKYFMLKISYINIIVINE